MTPPVDIRPVRSTADREVFIRLPWAIQGADPCWVPPLVTRQRAFLDPRRGPFFEFGEA